MIDSDGIVRRTPLLHEYGNAAYESLSLAMAATYLNEIALPVFVPTPLMMQGYPPLEAIELGDRRIPVDAQGAVLVPYRGGAGSFKYVSASDVIRGTVEDPAVLDGAIAIVGATAPGLQDLRSTPFGSIYPGSGDPRQRAGRHPGRQVPLAAGLHHRRRDAGGGGVWPDLGAGAADAVGHHGHGDACWPPWRWPCGSTFTCGTCSCTCCRWAPR